MTEHRNLLGMLALLVSNQPDKRTVFGRALIQLIADVEERAVSGRGRQVPRGVKRKMSNYPLRPRAPQPITRVDHRAAIRLLK